MKKICTLFLSLVFLMSICSSSFAAEKTQKVFEKKEITDLKVLYDKASKRETDDPEDIKKFSVFLEDAPGYKVNKKATTQKIKEVKRDDGSIESFYVTTIFADIKKPIAVASTSNKVAWALLLAAAKGWDETDSSISFRHVGWFHYSSYRDSNSILWVKPEKMVCQWYQLDGQVVLTEGKYGMQWWGINGSAPVGGEDYLYVPIPVQYGKTYENICKSVGGSGYINCTAAGSYVAGIQQSKLKRNTSTWTFKSEYVFAENLSY